MPARLLGRPGTRRYHDAGQRFEGTSRNGPGRGFLSFRISNGTAENPPALVRLNVRITVPNHKSIVPETLQTILRQAGITLDQFLDVL
jgi:hypothetical protein